MNWKDALSKIDFQQNTRLRFREPLAKHTHFGIGGEATAYIEVSTIDDLATLAHFHKEWKVSVAILGKGSNLLASDKGFNGLCIRLIGELANLDVDGNVVTVGAGHSLPGLSKLMSKSGLSGVEFRSRYSGISGWCAHNERRGMGQQFRGCRHRCYSHAGYK